MPAKLSHPSKNMIIFPRIFALVIVFIILATFASAATRLPADEVETLRQIAKALGKMNWDFSADPCSGQSGWVTQNPVKEIPFADAVNCSGCSTNECHISSIVLKAQNLSGTLPTEFVKLPHLQVIDLTRNYLNGTIPPEWGSLQLTNISLLGNRLTGSIPKEIGNISTLLHLSLEFNQLSGALPAELGNLSSIKSMHLTSNNFTGELPGTLAKLINLTEFLIGDNHFTGKIPDFIQNWTNLKKLVIQASGLDGPIPPAIASLTNLTDLRISDLNGTEALFPPLNNTKKLETLILRSCNIIGPIPKYLAELAKLNILDLSFNKLSGDIPSSFVNLPDTTYIYLTGNLLSGPVPDWKLKASKYMDLSYNNLSSGSSSCEQNNMNLFASSSKGDMSGIVSCLGSFQCPQQWSFFHINCGGEEATFGSTIYEADTDSGSPSKFFRSGTNWAFSSTGHFLDDNFESRNYISKDTSRLYSKLYMDARLSPISLTYYGFCLLNGNYTVKLHFAEIRFTDDKTYRSLGRRVFDVYIQGKLMLKDFNIEDKAGGVGKETIETFTAAVNDSTLEIRLYWAGKGTTGIPSRGVYGPLISAISVYNTENRNEISVGAVVGIVAAVAFVIILLLGILWWRGCLQRKDPTEHDLKGLDLQTGSFTLRQIKAATNNFDAAKKIGEGGFGSVYKGLLSDGTIIAVKQLSSKSKQGNREFVNEIGMISALQHPHLVKLYGCCIEGNQLLLIYEYMENNSLARALFGLEECQLKLDWPTRYNICIGIARGLAYLHEESRLKIVHRDIKATNVLLDKNLNPKISDFGLAKLDEEDDTHISTRIAGTYGYMAPEYAMHGYLTDKADVYSFGIVALEIVSGRSNTSYRQKEGCLHLLDWVLVLKKEGKLMELADPRLGSEFIEEEVMVMIDVALLCTNVTPAVRPTMSSVVSMLEGRAIVEELVSDSTVFSDNMKLKGVMAKLQHSHETDMTDSLIKSMSTEMPLTASSTSTSDLYPMNSNSDYWASRD